MLITSTRSPRDFTCLWSWQSRQSSSVLITRLATKPRGSRNRVERTVCNQRGPWRTVGGIAKFMQGRVDTGRRAKGRCMPKTHLHGRGKDAGLSKTSRWLPAWGRWLPRNREHLLFTTRLLEVEVGSYHADYGREPPGAGCCRVVTVVVCRWPQKGAKKMIIVQRRPPSTPMFLIQPEGERGIDGRLDNVD